MSTQPILNILSPQSIATVLFVLIFIAFWVFIFVIFYHLTRFGVGTAPKQLAIIFLIGSIALFCTNILFLMAIDTRSLSGELSLLIKDMTAIK